MSRLGFCLAIFFFVVVLVSYASADKLDDIKVKVDEIKEKVKFSNIQAKFFGTDYYVGENATIWLQLLDNYQPINDALCYVSVFNPNKQLIINNSLMVYLSEGIYYYDLIVPDNEGIYLLSAYCIKPLNVTNAYVLYDAYVRQGYNMSYSGSTYLQVGWWDTDRYETYVKFNISNIPTNFDTAYLFLYKTDGSNYNLYVHRALWDWNNSITWYNKPNYTGIYDFKSCSVGWCYFNITQLVKDWRFYGNYGLVVTDINSNPPKSANVFYSYENPYYNPFIIAYYTFYQYQEIRGQGEMNVKRIDAISDNFILKMLQHARILHDRIVNFHNSQYCINETALLHNITYEYCINKKCDILSDVMIEDCNYGCDLKNEKCKDSPIIMWLWLLAIFIIIIIIVVWVRRNL